MLRSIFLAIFCFLAINSYAGKITGTVKDSKDSSGLPGVIINVKTLDKGAVTDIDGHFEINDVPDGRYDVVATYVSYKKQTQQINVRGAEPVILNMALVSSNAQLSGVSVKAARSTQTEVAVLNEIRKSSVVVSGISAAQIGKTMDRNAADVVKRIPGVTIQDDRFIIIRGLADRYNTVWLNDAVAPSSEVDKKSFSFDLIPSGLIDRILIFKTPAANLPGDFAGGMVKIYTSSLPAKNEYKFAIQGSYRDGSTGTDFNYEPKHSGDAFGYDNGGRNLPSAVPGEYFDKNHYDVGAITRSFENNWIINTQKQKPDLRISGSAANIFKLGTIKLGNTFGFSYANTRTNYNKQLYDWDQTVLNYHYNDQESINKVSLALLDNITGVIGNSKIEFKNLYNQIGTSGVTLRTNIRDSALGSSSFVDLKGYQLFYENKRTYTSQLMGSHHNDENTRKYNWTIGYSNLFRNLPDLRRIQYTELVPQSGIFQAAVASGSPDVNRGGGKLYGKLNEDNYSFSHEFFQKLKINSEYSVELSLGNYLEYKNRNYDLRQLGYTIPATGGQARLDLLRLPVGQIFEASNVGDQSNFIIVDNTDGFDHYTAKNTLIASFVSLNIPIGDHIKALIGARYESNRQQLETKVSTATVSPDLKTNYLLPSANFTYNFTAKMLLRFAYGQTLNRPEFREQAPAFFYDYTLRAGTYGAFFFPGAKGLKVAEVQNFDFRWEYYPSVGELIHAGLFYKKFKNPIQQSILGGLQDKAFSYINGSSAYVAGLEIDARKNLDFLDDKLNTGFLKNFVLVGNLSLAKSELIIDSTYASEQGADVVQKGPLQGQSDYVVNAGIFYQNDSNGVQGSLLYNVYSPRSYAVGRRLDGSIGELAFHSLDLNLSKVFAKHYTLTIGIQNLLDQSIRYVEDTNLDNKFTSTDNPFTTYKPGRYFTLGIRVRF